ncbi:biosynthetic peptidoglycan transglycosylase [Scandinavium lactucae]|uniref:Biosynthetic peptidoglycan transglycosylase n=1 Tax=Scandinavium lactucae TaxID=3095028 RepID=A0ABU4QUY7_9ENTR|nr:MULTISPECIES: biosynthetic peptidoglycan transglycosylase [unclassified Scandinavium]MDX6042625.1 biosynthetic peptidoglycan transglycosylase [Scandinavium sp. V105_6]MDX6052626.1 biosynthetic peptidoglycan transglycosylase [Scandinavium sp. V105_1]
MKKFILTKYNEALKTTNLDGIPSDALDMLVALEDKRFHKHNGYDLRGMTRALYVFLKGEKIQGASTIEQQLVRVLTSRYERTIKRKIIEIYFARYISKRKSKVEIAKLYLSIAYFGSGMNGYHQAVKKLKQSHQLENIYFYAELVSRLRYPQPYNPDVKYFKKIHCRAAYGVKVYSRTNLYKR